MKNSSNDERLSKSSRFKSPAFIKKVGGKSLSGQAVLELLQAVLDRGVPFRFYAKGQSMDPFIRNGDIITISPFSGAIPRIGDIVAFVHPESGKLIVHRVIRKMDESFLTRGDGLQHSDGTIPMTNIIGFVAKVERNGRKVVFGLGLERLLIAFLSRKQFIVPIWEVVRKFIRPDSGNKR